MCVGGGGGGHSSIPMHIYVCTLQPLIALLVRLAYQIVGLLGSDELETLRSLTLDKFTPTVQVDNSFQSLPVGFVILEFRATQNKPSAIPVL